MILTHEELTKQTALLRTNPEEYVSLHDKYIQENPNDPDGYWSRHYGLNRIGKKEHALQDMDTALALDSDPHPVKYMDRGRLLLTMGRYREVIEDFDRAEALAPDDFVPIWGPVFRATCHARLGDMDAALVDWSRIPDNHWMPGIYSVPKGNKQELLAALRDLAARASRT